MNMVRSDWFYLKIYTEPRLQNRFLLDYVSPVLDYYSRQGMLKDWFFIRYSDENESRESLKANIPRERVRAISISVPAKKREDCAYWSSIFFFGERRAANCSQTRNSYGSPSYAL
jgi:Lantibiotic biosynthesis dehydratase C-term